jgi:aminopeptidase YwaD
LLAACAGGHASAPSAAPATETVAASPAAAPTATPDPIGAPVIDAQRAYAHVKKLAVDIGPRVAGTPAEITARDYIRSTLESYGYDVTVQDFGFDASAYLPARVDAGPAPGPSTVTSIPAIALRGSGAGTVEGRRLVAAGIGRPEDFPAGGLGGDIALIERGELTFAQKVANAIAAGASGVVIYNNQAERSVFDLGDSVEIPVVGIDQSAGQDLIAKLATQPYEARVAVSPPKGTAYNVVAKPKGAATCETVSGGHYDSVPVTGGADDNAAGAAAVLELARVVAAKKLPAHHCFVLFSAEEFGLFGSKSYVGRLSPEELHELRGMVNLDVVGTASGLDLIGDADLVDVARLEAEKLGVNATPSSLRKNTGSDHLSFENAGVHAVMLYREDNLIHTSQDAIDRIVPASLTETVAVALATLQALAP